MLGSARFYPFYPHSHLRVRPCNAFVACRIGIDDKPTFWKNSTPVITTAVFIAICVSLFLTGSRTIQAFAADETAVLVGAGDISKCNHNGDSRTVALLETIPGTIFTTGDNVYNAGTYKEYIICYEPTWGRFKDRTMPVPGNHDYRTEGAAGYYRYFNVPEYYAYDQGTWRIYALNSEINTSADGEQVQWLLADLAQNPRSCVMAYWHARAGRQAVITAVILICRSSGIFSTMPMPNW